LIGDFLGEVHAKVAAHFALEEKEMRDRRYQGYPEHKTDHETLLDEIRSIMDMHDTGGYAATGNDLADALTRWFGSHFRLHDARFHHAIIGKSAT
jgi:hemerythrin